MEPFVNKININLNLVIWDTGLVEYFNKWYQFAGLT